MKKSSILKISIAVAAAVIIVSALAAFFLYERGRVATIIDDEAAEDIRMNTIMPICVSIDPENLPDGTYPVSFDRTKVKAVKGGSKIEFEIFSHDCYNADELESLKPGGYIMVSGEVHEVKSVEKGERSYVINGPLELGGIELYLSKDGTYSFSGFSDVTTYTSHGKATYVVPESVTFRDAGNVEESMQGVTVEGKDLARYLNETDFGYFNQQCTKITVENGVITAFCREYRP